jgi:ribosomal protein S18 acetylase RimI-like enzyme
LLGATIADLRSHGTKQLLVGRTNVNTAAMRFYQKRGFRLHALRIGGVEIARRIKPSVPIFDFNNIRMRDAIDLVLTI